MKNHSRAISISLCAFALGVTVAARAAAPVITSFSGNGLLVCSNLAAGSVATVEWASSLSGPWTNNWAGLDAVTVDGNGKIKVSVPMFYRVRGTNSVPSGMVLIPAGIFTMGDANDGNSDGDAPTHTVNVSAFFMDTNLVTYTLWTKVYYWATSHGYSFGNAGSGKASNHPVQTINWYDCVKWCNARSEKEGRTPCYYTNASLGQMAIYRSGQFDLATNWVNWSAGYRLPTEAEWEKAARGGLSGQRFPWGNTISWGQANYIAYPLSAGGYAYDVNLTQGYNSAWTSGGSPFTTPVGTFPANGYGLYDMAGNVWEWCWDWYGSTYYNSSPGTNPLGPSSGAYRVARGGSWYYWALGCRTAYRGIYYLYPSISSDYSFGFRTVLPAGP